MRPAGDRCRDADWCNARDAEAAALMTGLNALNSTQGQAPSNDVGASSLQIAEVAKLERSLSNRLVHDRWSGHVDANSIPLEQLCRRASAQRESYFETLLEHQQKTPCRTSPAHPQWIQRGLAQAEFRRLGLAWSDAAQPPGDFEERVFTAALWAGGYTMNAVAHVLRRLPLTWSAIATDLEELGDHYQAPQVFSLADALDLVIGHLHHKGSDLARFAEMQRDRGGIHELNPALGRSTSACLAYADGSSCLWVAFDSTAHSVLRLAHELGHAYHYSLLATLDTALSEPSPCTAEFAAMVMEGFVADLDLPGDGGRALRVAQIDRRASVFVTGLHRYRLEKAAYSHDPAGTADAASRIRSATASLAAELSSMLEDYLEIHGLKSINDPAQRRSPYCDLNYIVARSWADDFLEWMHLVRRPDRDLRSLLVQAAYQPLDDCLNGLFVKGH